LATFADLLAAHGFSILAERRSIRQKMPQLNMQLKAESLQVPFARRQHEEARRKGDFDPRGQQWNRNPQHFGCEFGQL
jgi:hypothetical protein